MEHTPVEMGGDLRSLPDSHRSDMLEWVDMNENSPDGLLTVPPVSIIRYRDLLGRAWGWERLLANIHGIFDWPEYKRYAEEYFQVNTAKVAAGKDALHTAAKRCIETENRLIRTCVRHLSNEALSLSTEIQNRARDLIQSDGEYPVAAAALLSITKEAELMHMFLTRNFDISDMVSLSNKVRCSASNLMLYKGSESAVAAGAMVGVATEAQRILDSVHRGSAGACLDYFATKQIRGSLAAALTRLEEELGCYAGSDTCTGGGLDSEGSVSMGNSVGKKMDGQDSEKGNEKLNKNLNNHTCSAEEVREDKEVKVAGEETLNDFENGTKGEAVAVGDESGKAFADTGDT